ncbi:hypothetical protein [Viridibacillus soli]|uniref:hypothetical protein n=1 Tax=Viridibacillus soli TaxID=2798301 RepID=UPI001F478F61|nr:hypothetical protein [Viridibacillus soli]
MLDFLFTVIFVLGVYYLIRYRLNLNKAVQLSKNALYPSKEDEFNSIILPVEWREMEPLSKNTKSYQYVKWGTVVAIILSTILLWIVLVTDLLEYSFFSVAYIFFAIINAVRHRGNLFILPNGLIFNGRYYSSNQIKGYEAEKIIRWHELYGLNSKGNNAYKLTLNIKNKRYTPNFIVIKDHDSLGQILDLLNMQGISGITKVEQPFSSVGNLTNKS